MTPTDRDKSHDADDIELLAWIRWALHEYTHGGKEKLEAAMQEEESK